MRVEKGKPFILSKSNRRTLGPFAGCIVAGDTLSIKELKKTNRQKRLRHISAHRVPHPKQEHASIPHSPKGLRFSGQLRARFSL
jgi:hypothetical protein